MSLPQGNEIERMRKHAARKKKRKENRDARREGKKERVRVFYLWLKCATVALQVEDVEPY